MDGGLWQDIEQFLDAEIRPVLAQHEGDIALQSVDGGIVSLQLLGACSGCPAALASTGSFIRERLLDVFPQLTDVVFNSVSESLLAQARRMLRHEKTGEAYGDRN